MELSGAAGVIEPTAGGLRGSEAKQRSYLGSDTLQGRRTVQTHMVANVIDSSICLVYA